MATVASTSAETDPEVVSTRNGIDAVPGSPDEEHAMSNVREISVVMRFIIISRIPDWESQMRIKYRLSNNVTLARHPQPDCANTLFALMLRITVTA